ncbi:LOW QUALITY PROTEIN: senecionine N-oxygenase-like [Eurosta solidaginis]|uniref:LOW QUALITY PROTEIN: senecionine N-oxygenase-like n=1 Tax=Eurosta solidaginis TaxID=178769 RepID=UPI00353083EB
MITSSSAKRICVVGAGPGGLTAVKYSLAQGFDVICYEKIQSIGGQWVFTETAGAKCETDVHSSIYEELRTNGPKEIMAYCDFDYPKNIKESFISAAEVLEYHQAYAKHFKLAPHIKLEHEVIRIRPYNGLWEVYVLDKGSNQFHVKEFDFIFVCNGRGVTPNYAHIKDWEKYQGRRMHSHMYRRARDFKDETVLIIGSGYSGMDLGHQIFKYATHICISYHVTPPPPSNFKPNVVLKPAIKYFTANGACFSDGTTQNFSVVIYCTGFNYTAPFLSTDCGVFIDENVVYPLYKHCININQPTMAFVGLHINTFSALLDLTVRFALEYFSKRKTQPNRDDMLQETDAELAERKAKGLRKRLTHEINDLEYNYYEDLANTAGITPIKPAIIKIMLDTMSKFLTEFDTFRETVYEILDDENFVIYPNVSAKEAKDNEV